MLTIVNGEWEIMNYDKRVREKGETTLEQVQLVLLEMLKVVDAICRKHKIQYWLDAGNLLGAVRHNGFIPWDDDIDISMPRESYNRFIEVVSQELPEGLFFQSHHTDVVKKSKWLKIRDNYSTLIQNSERGKDIKFHQGIFLDIFPYDLLEKDFHSAKIFMNRKYQKSRNPLARRMRWLLNQCATVPVKLIGVERLKRYILKRYSGPNPCLLSTGIEVSNFYFMFNYDTVFPLGELDFNGLRVMVPNNVDQYLTDMFGDYMKIPDEKNRKGHAYKILPFTKCNHPAAQQY